MGVSGRKSNLLSWNEDWPDLVPNSEYFLVDDKSIKDWSISPTKKINVHYHPDLDGGGSSFGQRYKHILQTLYPGRIFNDCFEWCGGPGFIGFSLLSEGICQNLYLNDIYLPCIDSIERTIEHNRDLCQDHVFYKHCSGIKDLPSEWKFDLVVSNPPHWNPGLGQFITRFSYRDRICADLDWQLHKDFFSNIGKHLKPNGVILLQEQSYASGPEMFKDMIEENGLHINDSYYEKNCEQYYYLEVLSNNKQG